MRSPTLLYSAGLLGVLGVALGAFGAHALKDNLLSTGHLDTWETAVKYHLIHTVAILWAAQRDERLLRFAGWAWVVGILLFSGSLYALSLGGPRGFGPVTPLGGVFLIIGWALVAVAGRKLVSQKTD